MGNYFMGTAKCDIAFKRLYYYLLPITLWLNIKKETIMSPIVLKRVPCLKDERKEEKARTVLTSVACIDYAFPAYQIRRPRRIVYIG